MQRLYTEDLGFSTGTGSFATGLGGGCAIPITYHTVVGAVGDYVTLKYGATQRCTGGVQVGTHLSLTDWNSGFLQDEVTGGGLVTGGPLLLVQATTNVPVGRYILSISTQLTAPGIRVRDEVRARRQLRSPTPRTSG